MEANNMAAMRVALETLRELLEDLLRLEDAEYHNDFSNFCDIIDAALSAPPRNCDIYTTEDAVDTATVTVRDECDACPNLDMEAPCVFCMVRWLLAPATAKQGGAK